MKLPKIYMIYFENVPQGPEPLDGYCCLHITQDEPQTQILAEDLRNNQYQATLSRCDSRGLETWLIMAGLKNTVYVDGTASENTFTLDYAHFAGIWAMIVQRDAENSQPDSVMIQEQQKNDHASNTAIKCKINGIML